MLCEHFSSETRILRGKQRKEKKEIGTMPPDKSVMLLNLIMHDDLFRKAFMDDPEKTVQEWDSEIAPLEIKNLLIIAEEDLETTPSFEEACGGPCLCLTDIGCNDRNRQKPPGGDR